MARPSGAGLAVAQLDADFRITPGAAAQADSYKLGLFGSVARGECYGAGDAAPAAFGARRFETG